jgi:hypothetical protein
VRDRDLILGDGDEKSADLVRTWRPVAFAVVVLSIGMAIGHPGAQARHRTGYPPDCGVLCYEGPH